MESKHDGLEDDVPFQTPVFQVSCFFLGGRVHLILVLEGVMMMLTALVISKYRCGPRSVTWNSRFFRGGGDQIDGTPERRR